MESAGCCPPCTSAVWAPFSRRSSACSRPARRRRPRRRRSRPPTPVDSDRDGHVDGVSLKWSKSGPRRLRRQGAIRRLGPRVPRDEGRRRAREGPAPGRGGAAASATRAARCALSFRSGRRGTAPIKPLRGKRTAALAQARHAPLRHPGAADHLRRHARRRLRRARRRRARDVLARRAQPQADERALPLLRRRATRSRPSSAARGRFLKIDVAERGDARLGREADDRLQPAGARRASGSSPSAADAAATPSPAPTARRATACRRS